MRSILVAIIVLMSCTAASAWSTKEHILLTRLAVATLLEDPATPDAMKQCLRDANPGDLDTATLRTFFLESRQGIYPRGVDGLPYWSVVPDLVALTMRPDETAAPFAVHERLLHYLDVELFDPAQQDLPEEQKPRYKPDLSARPRLVDIPRDRHDPRYRAAGMLAFRVEQSYEELVRQLEAGRLHDKPGQFPRDEHATRWAGYLAHYVADNTQPHHATVDYKSRSYFPERPPDVHAQLEYKLVDDEHADHLATRRRVWDLLQEKLKRNKDPIPVDDVWAGSVQTSLNSYDALPLIGQAARTAWREADGGERYRDAIDTEAFYAHEGEWRGRRVSVAEMKAEQLALAATRIAAHWRHAWRTATGE